MRRILAACAIVVALGICLAVLRPSPVLSDEGLTALVADAYFPRTETLHSLAHQRVQYQLTYSGGACGLDSLTHVGATTAETLACNYVGPARAVEQWQGSPDHHAILSDARLNTIGCASAAGTDGASFFVCVLAAEPVEVARTPNPTPVGSIPTSGASPQLLPNTAAIPFCDRRPDHWKCSVPSASPSLTPAPTATATAAPTPSAPATPSATATPTPSPTATPTAPPTEGLWADLMALPTSGAAWDRVAATRFVGTGAAISDQDSSHDIQTMGAALYAARTGDQATRSRVIAALESAIGTENGGRWLAVGRNLGAYIIAADLIDLRSGPVYEWLARFMSRTLAHNNSGVQITFRQSAWQSGSNASAQEGFAFTALAVYLGDTDSLAWSWDAFRRYAGDRTSPHTITSNSDAWQQTPSDPVGIQNVGAVKNGCSIAGAISNDMSRGGSNVCSPGYTQYPWVGMEGSVPAALVFERAGYPAFTIQSSAIRRASDYLWNLGGDWYDATRAREVKHLLNWRYNLDRPAADGTGGRTFGFTEWTHR